MCIICIKKKDQEYDPRYIEKMYDMGNRDGFGMMWTEKVDGIARVRWVKSTGFPTQLKEIYKKYMDNDVAIHVRNATYGAKDVDNCHPYCVLDVDLGHKIDLYMMHNGTIREVQVDKGMSDSFNFATKFLRPLLAKGNNYKFIYDVDFQNFLAGIIGPNKLVFLDNKNEFIIINSDLGSYHPTGCWVSTKSDIKLPDPVKVHTPTVPVHNTSKSKSWDFEKGQWIIDNDNRLHFNPTPKSSTEEAETIIIEEEDEADTTDNGIQLSNDIDEEGLEAMAKRLPFMNRQDVYKFVIDFHLESVVVLSKLSSKSLNTLDFMVKQQPWEAVDLMIHSAKEKYGTDTSKVSVN